MKVEQFISRLLYKAERISAMGNRNKKDQSKEAGDVQVLRTFPKQSNVGLLPESSCDLFLEKCFQ